MMILKAVRSEKIVFAVLDYVGATLGKVFQVRFSAAGGYVRFALIVMELRLNSQGEHTLCHLFVALA